MTRRSFGHADPLQDRRRTGGSITAGPEDSGLLLTMRDANGDVPIGNVKTIVPDAGALEDLGGGVRGCTAATTSLIRTPVYPCRVVLGWSSRRACPALRSS